MFSIIASIDSKNGIGKNNDLLCKLPSDMHRFKDITNNHTVIMGRKTWESLPDKPLSNRHNIVITKQILHGECTIFRSIHDVCKHMNNKEEKFVIGGSSIYKYFLPFVKKMYISHIHNDFDADIFFHFDTSKFKLISKENIKDIYNYDFCVYEKI